MLEKTVRKNTKAFLIVIYIWENFVSFCFDLSLVCEVYIIIKGFESAIWFSDYQYK